MGTLIVGGAEIFVLRDKEAVARAAADLTIAALDAALQARGAAHWVLTGGSSAVTLYSLLPQDEWRARIEDWSFVHLWWGDERMVPPDHPESNVGLAYRALLAIGAKAAQSSGGEGTDVGAGVTAGLPIHPNNIHAPSVMESLASDDPGSFAAEKYAAAVQQLAPTGLDGNPEFDLIHLGVGPDGHILSVFPGSPALAPDAPLAMPIAAPEHVSPHIPRLTLTPRILAPAQRIIVMATGSAKAGVVAAILGQDRQPGRWPAQAVLLPNATWLIDAEAAAQLPH
ncbi:MAG TPA: 6-phosphogluconolactonase [Candidatus Limnocylindrales bacterium]|nr:6-phosphogluconolactonase [Candidatus Limnocylindrales bacterium]